MRKALPITISRHITKQLHTTTRIALYWDTPCACSRGHIHGKVAIADMPFQIGGRRGRLECLSVAEGVYHGLV